MTYNIFQSIATPQNGFNEFKKISKNDKTTPYDLTRIYHAVQRCKQVSAFIGQK